MRSLRLGLYAAGPRYPLEEIEGLGVRHDLQLQERSPHEPAQTGPAGYQRRTRGASGEKGAHLGWGVGVVEENQGTLVREEGAVEPLPLSLARWHGLALHPQGSQKFSENLRGMNRLALSTPQVDVELGVGEALVSG